MKAILFFGLLLSFFAVANFYIYKRFLTRLDFLSKYKKIVFYLMILLMLCELIFFVNMRGEFLNEKLYFVMAIFPSFTCFLLLFAVIYELGVWVFFNEKKKEQIFNVKRRRFLKLIFDSWLIILSFSMVFKGFANAISIPKINEVDIKIKNLKEDLSVVLVSDVHLGKNLGESFLEELIKKINSLDADLIVIAGDLIDANIGLIPYINSLEKLKSKYGIFYVYGNHEYYNGFEEISAKLKTLKNFRILENESVEFENFSISGVCDLSAKRFDYEEASLQNIKPRLKTQKTNILITHQPKFAKLHSVDDFDLVLAGHTHAGQIFPFSILVYLEQGFVYGLYKLSEKTKLYVSSGAGFWGPAVRFLAPSEIAFLKLKGE